NNHPPRNIFYIFFFEYFYELWDHRNRSQNTRNCSNDVFHNFFDWLFMLNTKTKPIQSTILNFIIIHYAAIAPIIYDIAETMKNMIKKILFKTYPTILTASQL